MSRPLPTLPLEIILEILRDYDLSDSDLARLCLVSRRILESVRAALYEGVKVSFVASCRMGQRRPSSNSTLASSAWCLLRTLQDHPDLSLLVQKIDFRYTRDNAPSPSRISLPIPQAISIFLELVPNLNSVTLGIGFDDSFTQTLQVFGEHAEKVKELYIWSDLKREHNFRAATFPHLKEFNVSHVFDNTGPDLAGLGRLQTLNIFYTDSPDQITGLLERSTSNLEYLCINAGAAATLDYSEFRQLRYLHLYECKNDKYASVRLARGRPNFNEFWSRLRRAPPSLASLSMGGARYEDGLEEDLFGNSIQTGVQLENIQRIRFEGSIPLDRIARLIHAPLLPNLRQVVVNYSPRKGESTAERLSRIEAASTLCSARGIDLLLRGWTG